MHYYNPLAYYIQQKLLITIILQHEKLIKQNNLLRARFNY